MHTNLGVPGLCGYPAIQYIMPALICAGEWGGAPSQFPRVWTLEGVEVVPGHLVD
jgi:hypothetical protein